MWFRDGAFRQWRSQLDGSGHAASPMYMGGSGGTPPENFEI